MPLYPSISIQQTHKGVTRVMVLELDGNSEHVAYARRKIGLFGKKIRFVTVLHQSNALNRSIITYIAPYVSTNFRNLSETVTFEKFRRILVELVQP